MIGAIHLFIYGIIAMHNRTREHYYNIWRNRKQDTKNAEENPDAKHIAELQQELEKYKKNEVKLNRKIDDLTKAEAKQSQALTTTLKDLEQSRKATDKLKTKLDLAERECDNLKNQVAELLDNQAKIPTVKAPRPAAESQNFELNELQAQVYNLTKSFEIERSRIDDIYALMSCSDEPEDFCCETEITSDWSEYLLGFTSRLLLYGGTPVWHNRIRAIFEPYNIKVKCYEPGDPLNSSMNENDILFINAIGNKHRYTTKCLNEARKANARVIIDGVHGIEKTMRAIFPEAKQATTRTVPASAGTS